MSASFKKKFLLLIDDGWRQEKADAVRRLQDWIDISVVTHDPMTRDILEPHCRVTLIEKVPMSRGLGASLVMFFARDLQTNLVQYRKRIKFHTYSLPVQIIHLFREFLGRLKLRPYSYTQAMEWLYRDSHHYDDILKGFDVLLYMPVSVLDKRIILEARNAGLEVVTWIYSWDNPMKDNEFFSDASRYLVWNEHNRKDLEVYQGIPPDKVDLVGPVQFDYLHEIDLGAVEPPLEPYVLFACAFGQTYHLEQEVDMILEVRRILDQIRPNLKLCVRPYPFRFKMEGYACLESVPGIEMLNSCKIRDDQVVIDSEVMQERIVQIEQAECLINPGSTIGLEASFTSTPILQLNFSLPNRFPDYQNTRWVYKNEHLKYIIVPEFPNVIDSSSELKERLQEVLQGDRNKFLAYSRRLQEFSDPLGVSCYMDVLGQKLREFSDGSRAGRQGVLQSTPPGEG